MTDELESILRETFESQESRVAGRDVGLATRARRVARRRRRTTWVTAGGLTLLTALGAGSLSWLASAAPPTAGPAPVPTPDETRPTIDIAWRLESSLGVEIEVPRHWETNDYGCNQTDKPSVVREMGATRECYTPEPTTKDVAILTVQEEAEPPTADLTSEEVRIGDTPATRMEGRLPDGRYVGRLTVPSVDIVLNIRTRDRTTTRRILDSLRIVNPDHRGCPSTRPLLVPQPPVPDNRFVPADPTSISICEYAKGPHTDGRLGASAELTGEDAVALATQLNAAPATETPDLPPSTCGARTSAPDVFLLVKAPEGTTKVWMTFNACVNRGLHNGHRPALLSEPLIHAVMNPLHIGYSFPTDHDKQDR